MALKTFKPTTPSLRELVIVDRSALYKGKPLKRLTEGKPSTGGRNNTGRITVRFHGGGHKQSYRIIDFKRRKLDIPAKVERIEYDPNRTSFIALIRYADDELAYIIAPQRLAVGRRGDLVDAGGREAGQCDGRSPTCRSARSCTNIEMKIGQRRRDGAHGPETMRRSSVVIRAMVVIA